MLSYPDRGYKGANQTEELHRLVCVAIVSIHVQISKDISQNVAQLIVVLQNTAIQIRIRCCTQYITGSADVIRQTDQSLQFYIRPVSSWQ